MTHKFLNPLFSGLKTVASSLSGRPILNSPKFDYPDPRILVPSPTTFGVDGVPEVAESIYRCPISNESWRSFRSCIILADLPQSLHPHLGELQHDTRSPARHIDGRTPFHLRVFPVLIAKLWLWIRGPVMRLLPVQTKG